MATEHVTDDGFEQDVLGSETPVLVDFWAEWCGPCKQLSPVLDEVASEMGDKLRIVKMNIDDHPNTPSKYGVRGIPTMMIFRNGELVASKTGAQPKARVMQWIEKEV